MSKTLKYAGIGSRETPKPVLLKMQEIAVFLAKNLAVWTTFCIITYIIAKSIKQVKYPYPQVYFKLTTPLSCYLGLFLNNFYNLNDFSGIL